MVGLLEGGCESSTKLRYVVHFTGGPIELTAGRRRRQPPTTAEYKSPVRYGS